MRDAANAQSRQLELLGVTREWRLAFTNTLLDCTYYIWGHVKTEAAFGENVNWPIPYLRHKFNFLYFFAYSVRIFFLWSILTLVFERLAVFSYLKIVGKFCFT